MGMQQRVCSIAASIHIKLQSYALHFFSVLSLLCVLAVLFAVVFCRHLGSLRRLTHGSSRRDACHVSLRYMSRFFATFVMLDVDVLQDMSLMHSTTSVDAHLDAHVSIFLTHVSILLMHMSPSS